MNLPSSDILKGKWKQLKGDMKKQWGKITDDELDTAEGSYDKLVGLIQEKYGKTKQQASDELDDLCSKIK